MRFESLVCGIYFLNIGAVYAVLPRFEGEREHQEPQKWNSNPKHGFRAISKWHEKRQKMMRKLIEKQREMDLKKTEAARQIAELRARNLLLRAQEKQAFLNERMRNDAILKDRLNQNRGINHNLDIATPSVKSHEHRPVTNPNHIKMIKTIVFLGDRSHGHKGPKSSLPDVIKMNNEIRPWKPLHISGTKGPPQRVTDLKIKVEVSTTPVSDSQTSQTTDITTEPLVSETTAVPTVDSVQDSSVVQQNSKNSRKNLGPAGVLSRPTDVILGNPKVKGISPSPSIMFGSEKQATYFTPINPIVTHKPVLPRDDVFTSGPSKTSNPSVNSISLSSTRPMKEAPIQNTPSLRELLSILNLPADIGPNFTKEMILKKSKIREILTVALHNITRLLTRQNSNPKQSVELHNPSNTHEQRSRASTEVPHVMATILSSSASTNAPFLTSKPISTPHTLIQQQPQHQMNKQQLSDLINNDLTKVHGVPTPVPGESTGGNIVQNTDNMNIRTDSPWEIHDGISGGLVATPKNVQIINIISSEGDSLIIDSITNAKSSSLPTVSKRTTFSSGANSKDSNITPLPQVLTTSPKPRNGTISIDIFAIAIGDMLRKAQSKST